MKFQYPALWLDDDVERMSQDVRALQRATFSPTTASKFREAVEELRKRPIEFAIVDLRLTTDDEQSGIDFCLDARHVPGYEDVHIIIFTGFLAMYPRERIEECRPYAVMKRTEETLSNLIEKCRELRRSSLPRKPRGHFLPGLEGAIRADADAVLAELQKRGGRDAAKALSAINRFAKPLLPYVQDIAKPRPEDPRRACSAAQQIVALLRAAENLIEARDIGGREQLGSVAAYWELRADQAYSECVRYNWWDR